jgi:hypothetical protein
MPTILVKTNGLQFCCEVTGFGECRFCGTPVVWAETQKGRAIPLEPFSESARYTESHFAHCRYRIGGKSSARGRARAGGPPPARGVEMTDTIWRQLIQLVHPDKHHGGNSEALANEVTKWLLQQKDRLIDDKDK